MQQAVPHHKSIVEEIGAPMASRRTPRPGGLLVKLVGVAIAAWVGAVIVAGPSIMSRNTNTAVELFSVLCGVAYGIFLATHSRSTHVKLERAYSAHLEELSQRLRTMAYRDALTGLYNHRYFYEQLSHELERSQRYAQPLTLLLMDMNNFKDINDTYGHMVGDKFLGLVGQIIAKQIRSSDIGARYGGDEFVVILPNSSAAEARITADKLSEAVAHAAALSTNEESVQLGISIGIATCPDDSRVPGELIEIADSRLYEVKARRHVGRGGSRRSA